MKFYNRLVELQVLGKAISSESSSMIVLSGRRRVGKTRLVQEFMKVHGGLQILIVPKEEKQVANDFAKLLSENANISFPSVADAIEYFFVNSKDRILYIDEFPNFLQINPAIPFEFQRLWEVYSRKTNKILIFSGSYTSMMDRIFVKKNAPLFNRASFKIILEELPLKFIWKIQDDLKINSELEKAVNYCIFGGSPFYYELLEKYGHANIVGDLFFGPAAPLKEEGKAILQDEFGSAYKKYFAILEAIGAGLSTGSEIASKIGMAQTTLSKYLMALTHDYKIISRIVSFNENPAKSKKGAYVIKDNLISFWFSLVNGKTSQPSQDQLYSFIGRRFEFLCADFLKQYLTNKNETVLKAGKWWGQVEVETGKFEQREIDVVIETTQAIYAGECKWTNKPVTESEAIHLKQSITGLPSKKPIKLVFFAKGEINIAKGENILQFNAASIAKELKKW